MKPRNKLAPISWSEYSDLNELDFIRLAELSRRADALKQREGIDDAAAQREAERQMDAEAPPGQIALPIESFSYKLYYRRADDAPGRYRIVRANAKGRLHDWPTTNEVLADIIRSRLDPACECVATFHPWTAAPDTDAASRSSADSRSQHSPGTLDLDALDDD